MRHQLNFYLNDDKKMDDYVFQQLSQEKNTSKLVRSLLYLYYKHIRPGSTITPEEFTNLLIDLRKEG